MDKLTMNFNGKDVPQVWFTRKEVIALLEAEHQASRKQALEEASQSIQSLFPEKYVEHTSVYEVCFNNGIHACANAIRSLEGNATKETT